MAVSDPILDFLHHNKNYNAVKTTAPVGGVNVGNWVQASDLWGVAYNSALEGEILEAVIYADKLEVWKTAGVGTAFAAPGAKVFLNTTTGAVSNADGGTDLLVGHTYRAASDTDPKVWIRLDSTLAW